MNSKAVKLIAALSFAFLSGATAANAGDVAFRYNTHELSSDAGVGRLYKRIVGRAQQACVTPGPRGLWRVKAESKCIEDVTNDIVSLIDDSRLYARHYEIGVQFARR